MPPTPPPDLPRCPDHPARAIARCTSCNRPLCDECFRFRLDSRPACARCAYEASTRPQRRVSLAASFLCLTWGGELWVARRYGLWDDSMGILILLAIAAPAIAYLIAASAKTASAPAIENRERAEDEVIEGAFDGARSPYRAHARRVLLSVSPRVSGKSTALIVGASLVGSAILLPTALKLPRWIEAELVLALWWAIMGGTLTALLYRGFHLADDYVYFLPWNRPSSAEGAKPAAGGKSTAKASGGGWSDGCSSTGCSGVDGCSGIDGEGAIAVVVVAIALGAALGAAWILVELAMPVIFLLMYSLLMAAIRRVAHDQHGCSGALGKSLGWGLLWATLYVVPLAGITWVLHALHR